MTPVEVVPVEGRHTRVHAGDAAPHGAGSVSPAWGAPPPVPTTLGGQRPSKSFWSTPFHETWYWLPCITRSPLDEGVETHAHFLTSNLELHARCPACEPRRTRMSDLPWASGDPPWIELGMPSLQDFYEDRAATLEYEGGLVRALANDLAYRETVALARARL